MATLTEKREKVERERLLQLAESYKSKGYEVILNPSAEDLPDFLDAYHPDMVVHCGNENVVVQVKSRFSLANSSSYLRDLANVIEQHPD
jgi:Holliday junction resolvase